jgi:hypothetical protein
LVRDRWGETEAGPAAFPGGAALADPSTQTAWVLVADADHRALGGALAWASRAGCTKLHLLVETTDEVSGLLARRAALFAWPITVWRVNDRHMTEAVPSPLSPPPALPPEIARFADLLRAHGADPVVEFGVLSADLLGLEVARVVADAAGPRLEVGVGSHDREAGRLLFPDRPAEQALSEAVALVRRLRTASAPPHLANTLAKERWLRAVLVARPELVGAAHLAPVPPPVPRRDLRRPHPAPAAGVDLNDRPIVVVCSSGIDLNLVPAAADAWLADGRDGCRLIIAVPSGDDHPVTRDLAAALREPATVVTVPADWNALVPS